MHVRRGECVAKFWIVPDVSVENSYGFRGSELNELMEVIEEHRAMIERRWHEYFGD